MRNFLKYYIVFKKITCLLFLAVLFATACRRPKELVYQNVQNFKVVHAGIKETVLSADVFMYNPNKFSLKLKGADVGVFMNENHLGNMTLDSLFRVPAKDSFSLPVVLSVDMGSLMPGALQLLFSGQVDIKIKGSIKAGKHGIYVSVPVNYEGKQDVTAWMK